MEVNISQEIDIAHLDMGVHSMQCDQMARIYFNIGHLKESNFAQKHEIFAKVGSKFCQARKKLLKVTQIL